MVFDDSIKILDDVFMVEVLYEIYFLFNRLDFLLANRHFFHGHEHAIIEIDAFINQPICTFSNGLNDLITLNNPILANCIHCSPT